MLNVEKKKKMIAQTDASQQKIPVTFSIIVKPYPLYVKDNEEQIVTWSCLLFVSYPGRQININLCLDGKYVNLSLENFFFTFLFLDPIY